MCWVYKEKEKDTRAENVCPSISGTLKMESQIEDIFIAMNEGSGVSEGSMDKTVMLKRRQCAKTWDEQKLSEYDELKGDHNVKKEAAQISVER